MKTERFSETSGTPDGQPKEKKKTIFKSNRGKKIPLKKGQWSPQEDKLLKQKQAEKKAKVESDEDSIIPIDTLSNAQ